MLRSGPPSKATASTLCQKCLKRDIYECKAVAQERPYVSRPSRSQMLANPKLMPKLASDVPQDLLRKKGVADEQLAKKELGRGRERARDISSRNDTISQKRTRSLSSSLSVSTISTSSRRSISPPGYARQESRKVDEDQPKRRRSSSSSRSMSRSVSRGKLSEDRSKRSRRRISETSPVPRGRKQNRSTSRPSPYSSRSRSLRFAHSSEGRESPANERNGVMHDRVARIVVGSSKISREREV